MKFNPDCCNMLTGIHYLIYVIYTCHKMALVSVNEKSKNPIEQFQTDSFQH